MNDQTVTIKGKFTTWALTSGTRVEDFRKGLASLDLERFAPDEVSRKTALKKSLQKICAHRRRLVREVSGGYAIVTERQSSSQAGGATLTHDIDYHAVFSDAQPGIVFQGRAGYEVDSGQHVLWQDLTMEARTFGQEWEMIRAEFAHQVDLLPSEAVAASLTKIVDFLHGIPMRPRGGVYWIPDSGCGVWKGVTDVVAQTSGCEVFSMRTVIDDEGTRMVNVALVNSIGNELEKLTEEFGKISSRNSRGSTWDKKRDRIDLLRQRALGYESMLNSSQTDLKAHIEKVDNAAAVAALAAMQTA